MFFIYSGLEGNKSNTVSRACVCDTVFKFDSENLNECFNSEDLNTHTQWRIK